MVSPEEDSSNGAGLAGGSATATYALPQPLSRILRDASAPPLGTVVDGESFEEALRFVLQAALESMDSLFFGTPPPIRKHEAFQHRLCIRVEATGGSLSITDLGGGMTRADLINQLGVGHLSPRAMAYYRATLAKEKLNNRDGNEDDADEDAVQEEQGEEEDDDDDDDEEEEDGEEEEEDDEDEEDEEEEEDEDEDEEGEDHAAVGSKASRVIPCRADDIGPFYAALCALGVGVNVGTKSKDDEYYEFSLSSNYQEYQIVRPMEREGSIPSVETGFTKFTDVRGESGTRITFLLSSDEDDEEMLRSVAEKILERSPYSVAFSSDQDEAARIIAASEQEVRELGQYVSNQEDGGVMSYSQKGKHDLDDEEDEPMSGNNGTKGKNNRYDGKLLHQMSVKERAKYIPIRLSLQERKMLRLVEACMVCCDYTTLVDRPFKSSTRRIHAQLKGITSVLRGMATACSDSVGEALLNGESYSEHERAFQNMFEIARRHKVMNPEKMRTEYGKLVYLLQDAVSPQIQPHLSMSCKGEIWTVYKFLERRKSLDLLEDGLIETATEEILAGRKSRAKIQAEIKRKERAVAILKQNYVSKHLSKEEIHLCLYSICDNNSFLNSNRVPIDKVIGYLHEFFSPDKIEPNYSLSIVSGKDGARLSHSHERQFYFALQSMTLWRDIVDDMFRLWHLAEEDLLSETVSYSLQDTGQGMQRVQQSPRTYRAMQQILDRVQRKVKHWVGSSVIHLGDHNVPNALMFIDKYTQVPRILGPLVACIENLEKLCDENDGIHDFVNTGFGGLDRLKKDILYDFFKSAFDGSGADNFYDAGSCIDGRLTSAWNWCSQLPDKSFYCIFKLTGFTGFDGEFKD